MYPAGSAQAGEQPEQLVEFANTLVMKAFGSGLFMYADTDLKFDQPQAEVVFNRDKLRAEGVSMASAGLDLSTLLSGNAATCAQPAFSTSPCTARGAASPSPASSRMRAVSPTFTK